MIMSQKFNDVKMISINDKKREIVVYSKNTFPRKMIFYMYDDFNNMLKTLCANENWKSLIIK